MHHTPYNKLVITSSPLTPPMVIDVEKGITLLEMVKSAQRLPDRFWDEGKLFINGHEIPMDRWHVVRPKKNAVIQLALNPAGGGKKGSKNILAIVASILLIVVTVGVGAGLLAPLLGAGFAAGSFGAQAAAALIGLGGQLLLNSLFPPPVPEQNKGDVTPERASISDNVLSKGQTIPCVVGTMKVAPPLLAQPYSYLVGQDEYAEAVYALSGPTQLTDIRSAGTALADLDGVEYILDYGLPNTPRKNMFTRYGKTQNLQIVMTNIKTRNDTKGYDPHELVNQNDPAKSLPQWHRFRTYKAPDEVILRLTLGNMTDPGNGDQNTKQIVRLRPRIRKVGETTWKNCPELLWGGYGTSQWRRQIQWVFGKPGVTAKAESLANWQCFLWVTDMLPAVTVFNYFYSKIGGPAQWQASIGTYRYSRVDEGVILYLDDPYFNDPNASYEIEMKRSVMEDYSDYSNPQLAIAPDNGVTDQFDSYRDTGAQKWMCWEVNDQQDTVVMEQVTSLFYGVPVPADANLATIQLRVKNLDFSQLTTVASGLIPTWNGTDWSGLNASSNPADWYREMLANVTDRSVKTIDPKYLDDSLAAWRDVCAANNWKVNAIVEGSFAEAENMITAAGFAKPVEDQKFGVIYRRDTSGEAAVQMFTPFNTRDIGFDVVYSERPIGFRVEFYNAANDFEQDEVIIYDPYTLDGYSTDLETVNYPGITNAALVVERALYDFEQSKKAIRWTFTVGIESIASKIGDVVLLSHNSITTHADWFYVDTVMGVNQFRLDRPIDYISPTGFFDISNLFDDTDQAALDIFRGGDQVGLITRSGDRIITHTINAFDPDTGIFTVDDSLAVRPGDLCIVGPLTNAVKRTVVTEISPDNDFTAKITVMEE